MPAAKKFEAWCEELWSRASERVVADLRPHMAADREKQRLRRLFEGILYKLKTGCQWNMLPKIYGSKSSVHEHFQRWVQAGIFEGLFEATSREYAELAGFRWEWQSMDGTIVQAPTRQKKAR